MTFDIRKEILRHSHNANESTVPEDRPVRWFSFSSTLGSIWKNVCSPIENARWSYSTSGATSYSGWRCHQAQTSVGIVGRLS